MNALLKRRTHPADAFAQFPQIDGAETMAEHRYTTFRRPNVTRDHIQQCRLSRAVEPEQCPVFAAAYAPIDIVQNPIFAPVPMDVFYFDDERQRESSNAEPKHEAHRCLS